MTTAFKRTILFLMAIFVLEMISLSVLVFTTQGNAIAGGIPEMMPADPTYMEPAEEAVIEPEVEVAVEQEAVEAPEEETETVVAEAEMAMTSSDGYVNANVDGAWIAGSDFRVQGVHYDGSGYSYTYYSEQVLPGGGLNIPGRHVGDEGYICDGDGNLCLASDDLPYGTVVNVPFGSGTAVVYDCGSGYGNLDVYVSW